ncbi:MAG: adenylate/guanylate cyclase domain-containing protein [Chloroflexota bacterium]
MICASCGTENEPGRKFCLECGHALALICASCGSPNVAGARFCGECGSPLAEADAAVSTAASTPTSERRLVSVLFADLVGFTTISEARDAEDVRELLGRYFDASREVVDRYGGTVEKFIGDAVMAVWGTPVAQEDDAERAVRAALELVDAIQRLGESAGVPDLALRAAVHTGEAVVTIGATGMGMVAGDLVNTASRLQSVAPAGSVLVGDGTRRAASDAIVFEALGEQALRGKASPVPAFRALRVVARRGGAGRAELEAPFVGRDSELRLIKDFYHATARERGPRIVSVIGQAGIGKSRLSWEFSKYLDGVTELVYAHQGRSPAYGEGISFWALGEMVRMRAGISEGDDEAATRERLAATLDEFVPDADERSSLEGPLLQLLGFDEGHPRERGELFLAWRTFFERLADVAPVLMVFEDLQWADDGLLDFIEELAAWSHGRSIYIITLSRPELLDRRPTWGAGQRSFTSLSLAPLSDDEMTELLGGLVPGLPESVVEAIVARAEGTPLYAVETVRMLLNDGKIERAGQTYRPVGDLTELAVPESLHALIASRIDALPAAERGLVQDASVLGLSFGLAALTAVVRAPADQIDPMLRHLGQRQLLILDDDPRSPERGNFRFMQGLMREVAYGTLSRDDRRTRHLAAARYYEALGDDELAGVLAQHYVDAYQAHPDGPEGAAVAAQARVALRAAAQRAAGLGSFRHAHGYLESAILVTSDAADELELQMAAATAAIDGGLSDRAVAHGERTIALATELGDAAARRRSAAQLGHVLSEGHHDRARQVLTDAFNEPGLAPQDPGYVEIAESLAKLEMRSSNEARAIEIANLALPSAEAAGLERLTVDLLITRGTSLGNLGRQTEAVVELTGALAFARRRSLIGSAARAGTNLSYVLDTDDPLHAYEVAREALEYARQTGLVWDIRYLLGNAADGAVQVGDWDWVVESVTEQLDRLVEPAERLWYGSFLTVIRAYRGEAVEEDAQKLYDESRAFDDPSYRATGASALVVANLVAGGLTEVIRLCEEFMAEGSAQADPATWAFRAALWLGDLVTARRMRQAFEDDARTGRRYGAVRATMDAGLAILEGRTAEARAGYADAQHRWRELGLPLWVAMCDLDIVIGGAMQPDERRRAADEAREIFGGLRAQALIDRLDVALAASAEHSPPSAPSPDTVAAIPQEA